MARGFGEGEQNSRLRDEQRLEDIFARMAETSAGPNWWSPPEFYALAAKQFGRKMGIDTAVAQRVLKENYNSYEERAAFYSPDLSVLKTPEETVPGMQAAAKRIGHALKEREKIAIFSDYDPDGTCGTEALRLALANYNRPLLLFGYADAKRGFGLTNQFVEQAHKWGAKVLITVDCGSTQTGQVQLAKNLGMDVIVVDHHHVDPTNPADHHLNPKLQEPSSSENTGAQLAWKLGLAVHEEMNNGEVPEAYYGRAMYLAGFGARADMGSVIDPENRLFFWHGVRTGGETVPPVGVRMLSERLGEDASDAGNVILTSAAMNLPKRTVLVEADDIGKLLRARTEAEASPLVDKLVEAYDRARPVKQQMIEDSMTQIKRRKKGGYTQWATLEDFEDYAGYTGTVANKLSRDLKKPVIVFAYKGKDELDQDVYKFSIRNEVKVKLSKKKGEEKAADKHMVGELIADEAMLAACSLRKIDESGAEVVGPSIGGHDEVVSGSCTRDQMIEVRKAFESWAEKKAGRNGNGWAPKPKSQAEAYPTERLVDASRLESIEKDSRFLGPYGYKERHFPVEVSMLATVDTPTWDDDKNGWFSNMTFENGLTRPCQIHPDKVGSLQVDRPNEYIMNFGSPGNYYLRTWFAPRDMERKASILRPTPKEDGWMADVEFASGQKAKCRLTAQQAARLPYAEATYNWRLEDDGVYKLTGWADAIGADSAQTAAQAAQSISHLASRIGPTK